MIRFLIQDWRKDSFLYPCEDMAVRKRLIGAYVHVPFSQIFAYTPHQGSVRSLAIPQGGVKAGSLLVSGGVDEHIRMYDLRKRAEVGELLHHKGTITALGFVGSSHLLSGSEDGAVCIWRVYDWSLLHILGGHKGAITAVAIHPSGKLALSSGRDRSLRLWDLVRGRCAYITKLEAVVETVKWSGDGSVYALQVGDRRLEVRRASDNKPTAIATHPARVTAIAFLPAAAAGPCADEAKSLEISAAIEQQAPMHHVVTACDDGMLRVVDGDTGSVLSCTETGPHCGRIKEAVVWGNRALPFWQQSRELVTASSDGKILVWRVGPAGTQVEVGPGAALGAGVRITCLAAYAAGEAVDEGRASSGTSLGKNKKKRKRVRGEETKEANMGPDRAAPRKGETARKSKGNRHRSANRGSGMQSNGAPSRGKSRAQASSRANV